MAANSKILAQAAERLGIVKNDKEDVAYGVYNNFSVLIFGTNSNGQYITMAVCANANGQPFQREWINRIALPSKVTCSLNQYRINISFRVNGFLDAVEKIVDSIKAVTDTAVMCGCVNCDETGTIGPAFAYSFQGNYVLLNTESASKLYASVQKDSQIETAKNENYFGGVVGALLGSVVGAIVILLIAQLGRIATLGGIVMGMAIVFGYKKLGKKFSIFSVIICLAISVLMTYTTCRLSAAIEVFKAFDGAETFGYCFAHAKEVYEWSNSLAAYNHNFIFTMIVGIVGTIAMVVVEYSSQEKKFQMYKL